jgi:hypothetical protein
MSGLCVVDAQPAWGMARWTVDAAISKIPASGRSWCSPRQTVRTLGPLEMDVLEQDAPEP